METIKITLKSCMLLELVQSQCHSETQMGCVHAPRQCFSSNSQDKIAKKGTCKASLTKYTVNTLWLASYFFVNHLLIYLFCDYFDIGLSHQSPTPLTTNNNKDYIICLSKKLPVTHSFFKDNMISNIFSFD